MSEKQGSDWPLTVTLIVLILSVASCTAYDLRLNADVAIAKAQHDQ